VLRAPTLPEKELKELTRLAREIPSCPGVPGKQSALLSELRAKSGIPFELWQLEGAVFWPSETRTFIECALVHTDLPDAPTRTEAATWIDELRARGAPLADVHATLCALELLARRPADVARLVFFTQAPPGAVLDALLEEDPRAAEDLLGAPAAELSLGSVDTRELAELVSLANHGIGCADSGDREGLSEATRDLSRRTGQTVSDQDLRSVPGAMNTDVWVRGLLLGRNLLTRKVLVWAEFVHAVERYFAALEATREDETTAFETLLDEATPYPHYRIHHELDPATAAHEITRHVPPWGDPPPVVPAPSVEDVWAIARRWADAREAKNWPVALAHKHALESALDETDVAELRELLGLSDAERRSRMQGMGLVPAKPTTRTSNQVSHPKFGLGTVVSRSGDGETATLEVRFGGGVKKLQARFVEPVE
jgi:hypothetical protein